MTKQGKRPTILWAQQAMLWGSKLCISMVITCNFWCNFLSFCQFFLMQFSIALFIFFDVVFYCFIEFFWCNLLLLYWFFLMQFLITLSNFLMQFSITLLTLSKLSILLSKLSSSSTSDYLFHQLHYQLHHQLHYQLHYQNYPYHLHLIILSTSSTLSILLFHMVYIIYIIHIFYLSLH